MPLFVPIPLQGGLFGVLGFVASVIVPLLIVLYVWSIQHNVRQIAADVERIADSLEDAETREDEEQ